jgi:hypothetical protein
MEIIGQKSTPRGNLLNIENDEYAVYFGMMIDHKKALHFQLTKKLLVTLCALGFLQ